MAKKVIATPEALQLLAEIVAGHGPVLFDQSGGCCDDSSPMCYRPATLGSATTRQARRDRRRAVLGLSLTPQRRFYATSEGRHMVRGVRSSRSREKGQPHPRLAESPGSRSSPSNAARSDGGHRPEHIDKSESQPASARRNTTPVVGGWRSPGDPRD
jgi:hypothetical protein